MVGVGRGRKSEQKMVPRNLKLGKKGRKEKGLSEKKKKRQTKREKGGLFFPFCLPSLTRCEIFLLAPVSPPKFTKNNL